MDIVVFRNPTPPAYNEVAPIEYPEAQAQLASGEWSTTVVGEKTVHYPAEMSREEATLRAMPMWERRGVLIP